MQVPKLAYCLVGVLGNECAAVGGELHDAVAAVVHCGRLPEAL
jgi:hypothetical protein